MAEMFLNFFFFIKKLTETTISPETLLKKPFSYLKKISSRPSKTFLFLTFSLLIFNCLSKKRVSTVFNLKSKKKKNFFTLKA